MKINKQNFRAHFLLILLLLNAVIFYALYVETTPTLTVTFLDIGQGDAIFIQTPSGKQMLIDGGPNMSVLRELGKVMPFYDRSIDVVLATHADQDHIGGLVEIIKRFEVDLFIRTNTAGDTAVYEELLRLVKEKNIKEEIIMSPAILTLSPRVEFDILFPTQDTAGWETNESSIVGKLVYGQNSFLLTGDSSAMIEKYLVSQYGDFLQSDVLKAGHHGSKTSSSEIFVGTVAPTHTVISAGLNNKYNHPSLETMATLAKFKTQVLSTLGQGLIKFETDGMTLISNR